GIQEEQVVPARYRQEFLTIAWEHGSSSKYFSLSIFFYWSFPSISFYRAIMTPNLGFK
ncbi:hypothetical protein CCACVL1_01336, partial [Corchorus capsularis]